MHGTSSSHQDLFTFVWSCFSWPRATRSWANPASLRRSCRAWWRPLRTPAATQQVSDICALADRDLSQWKIIAERFHAERKRKLQEERLRFNYYIILIFKFVQLGGLFARQGPELVHVECCSCLEEKSTFWKWKTNGWEPRQYLQSIRNMAMPSTTSTVPTGHGHSKNFGKHVDHMSMLQLQVVASNPVRVLPI